MTLEPDSTEKARGARIRARREGLGLLQSTLGSDVGVSRQQVSAWENGRQTPSGENLVSLAKRLGVTPDWILSGGSIVPGEDGPRAGVFAKESGEGYSPLGPSGVPDAIESAVEAALDAVKKRREGRRTEEPIPRWQPFVQLSTALTATASGYGLNSRSDGLIAEVEATLRAIQPREVHLWGLIEAMYWEAVRCRWPTEDFRALDRYRDSLIARFRKSHEDHRTGPWEGDGDTINPSEFVSPVDQLAWLADAGVDVSTVDPQDLFSDLGVTLWFPEEDWNAPRVTDAIRVAAYLRLKELRSSRPLATAPSGVASDVRDAEQASDAADAARRKDPPLPEAKQG